MYSEKITIHGNPDEFLHTGAIAFTLMWLFAAIILFIIDPVLERQIPLQSKFILFPIALIVIMSLGIYIQTITINDKYLIYSSNFFPLIKRKILISDIASIGFGKNFMAMADPSGLSQTGMAFTDEPIIGDRIYNKYGKVIGGFNSKVYNLIDLDRIINKLKEINPQIRS